MAIFSIERMNINDVELAIEWAAKEGWNPGLSDAKCFYAADPKGFFIGKLDGKPVAVGSAVVYNANYAFCGLYIVSPNYRSHGYGLQLTKARLEYVGDRITGIYGVMNMTAIYSRLGYKIANLNVRYFTKKNFQTKLNSKIVNLSNILFQDILEYDQRFFSASRPDFLQAWIAQPESFALGYIDDKKLCGYGVIRKCREGYKIGPLFADTSFIADAIFEALATKAENPPFFIDIPEVNKNSRNLVMKYNMQEVFTTASMYRNGIPDLPVEKIYGITTLELG